MDRAVTCRQESTSAADKCKKPRAADATRKAAVKLMVTGMALWCLWSPPSGRLGWWRHHAVWRSPVTQPLRENFRTPHRDPSWRECDHHNSK
jgi:hypothetical protein